MKDNIVVVFSSHRSGEENQKFIDHISSTIGVKHNTICYPNFNQFSLAEIYNQAVREYTEDNCIFVMCHNDIEFKTKNWGKQLLNRFKDGKFDIIGVAGSTYLPETGRWWDDRSKMLGIVEHSNGLSEWVSEYSKEIFNVKETVLIDGLFMAFNPDTIINKFDESYKGFHFYDLGFCIPNYLDGCNIGVTTSIRILHHSVGQTNQEWELNRVRFAKEYDEYLPLGIQPPHKVIDLDTKLDKYPRVSVIIPTKNNLKYIKNNILSWGNEVSYNNYEIIIADTGSSEDVIKAYDEFLGENVKLVRYDYYNFGKINNDVVKNHVGDATEVILFCNDDIVLLNDALSRCVQVYNENLGDVGTIGIRLHYGDGSIQHNGISIHNDAENKIRLSHVDIRKTDKYSTKVNYNSKGNTGGFMLINKIVFEAYGGFNEDYIECLEDVELNLKCKHNGLKNITVSDAVAYHYESISRNKIAGGDERFMADYERLTLFIKNNNINI